MILFAIVGCTSIAYLITRNPAYLAAGFFMLVLAVINASLMLVQYGYP
jgi:protein-S-isoprenylcysteine O-methyltransferase Ste14